VGSQHVNSLLNINLNVNLQIYRSAVYVVNLLNRKVFSIPAKMQKI
jgi:hypothetical protein